MKLRLSNKWTIGISLILIVALIFGSAFVLNRQKVEGFGRSFNAMNDAYKKVLFATGQNQSVSIELMSNYTVAWNSFYTNYGLSPIKPYSADSLWQSSLTEIRAVVNSSQKLVLAKQFHDAHLELEKVRGVWQEVFVRNNVTMLGFYLTEYHDTMEIAITQADDLDYASLKITCDSMMSLWNNVKETQIKLSAADLADYNSKLDANSENINRLCSAVSSKDDVIVEDSASKLKGLFIPLYLKYG